jgi:hypothetical protein
LVRALRGTGAIAALAALLVCASAGQASARSYFSATFELPSDHGMDITFRADGGGSFAGAGIDVSDWGRRGGADTSYSARRVKVTPTRFRAALGALGHVNVIFEEKSSEKTQEAACDGYTLVKRGTFTGEFEFEGEHRYAVSKGTRAKGSVTFDHLHNCDHDGGGGLGGHGSRSTTLVACPSSSDLAYYAEVMPKFDFAFHSAVSFEERRQVAIFRTAFTSAHARTFAVGEGGGTATLAPPAPFRGGAELAGRSLTGDLGVKLLGLRHPASLAPAKARLRVRDGGAVSGCPLGESPSIVAAARSAIPPRFQPILGRILGA